MDVELPNGQADDAADADWVARALAGDRAAFDRLVARYDRRAFAVAYRLLGHRQDALEACQEAFLRGYRSLATLQDPARFGPWLLRIVGNLSLNLRRSRRHTAVSLDARSDSASRDRLGEQLPESDTAATPDAAMQADELSRAVRDAVAELPERQRLALTLFSMNGMSQKEVAEILDCSIEAVKWYVFQARKTLRAKLHEYL